MRTSQILRLCGNKVVLRSDFVLQLNLLRTCTLYARPLPEERSAIVSVLPPSSWARAIRVVVYTGSTPGSFDRVTLVLSKLGLNMLNAWAAATTPSGELCATAIVELPILPPDPKRSTQVTSRLDALISQICDESGNVNTTSSTLDDLRDAINYCSHDDSLHKVALNRIVHLAMIQEDKRTPSKPLLSTSDLFKGDGVLFPVYVTPLSILAKHAELCKDQPTYHVSIDDWVLDLGSKPMGESSHLSLVDCLSRLDDEQGRKRHTSVLITPDTEERYFRVALLDPDALFRTIQVRYRMTSNSNNYRGIYQSCLHAIANAKLNVFTSKNTLVSKTIATSEVAGSEEVRLDFVVDAKAAAARLVDSPAAGTQAIKELLAGPIENAAKQVDGKIENYDVRYSILQDTAPRCFFATNAKKGMLPDVFDYARRLFKEVRSLGLQLVNIDITVGDLRPKVQLLLDICPVLVSLHLPEEHRKLVQKTKRSGQTNYAASEWVVFEESYMIAKGRTIFIMRHESVRQPAYVPGIREYVFRDQASFHEELNKLKKAIELHQKSEAWRTCLQETLPKMLGADSHITLQDLHTTYLGDD